jgi:DNA processing protein
MDIKKLAFKSAGFPGVLRDIPHPPKVLYHAGAPLNDLLKRPSVAIVGSPSISTYGRKVTIDPAGRLAEQGVVVISGLALGVDCLAHQAALEADGKIRSLGARQWAIF